MTRPETRLQRAVSALDTAIGVLDAELSASVRTPGVPESDLAGCRESLVQMRAQLLSGGGARLLPGYGYVIVDSWPRNTAVGSAILKAENEYELAWRAIESKR